MPPAKVEPGRDPAMVERTQKLNVAFALSSLILFLVLGWMIWADYDREWRPYQITFNAMEVKTAEGQIKEVEEKVDATRRAELERRVREASAEVAARRADTARVQKELDGLQGAWYRVDQDFRFTKAEIDVARYEFEEARQRGYRRVAARKAALDALEARWATLRLELEDVLSRQEAKRRELAETQKARLAAEALEKELYGERARLLERLGKIRPGLVSIVRNLPILDLANPSLKVNQIMPANLNDDVIFSQTQKVDRCTTCHLGIDKKGYEDAPQPYRTHPELELYLQGPHPLEKIGCTACHLGRGRGTSFVKAAHTASTVEQEKAWGRHTGSGTYHALHYWDTPMLARGHTQSQCVKCHLGLVVVPKAARLNLGLRLIERNGCHGCHKIKGWENLRKAGPDLSRITSKTTGEFMFRWIQEPRGFRPTRMPQIWHVRIAETPAQKVRNDVEVNAVVAYLSAKSQRLAYPAPPRGDLAAGRRLFERVGCLACHRIGDDQRGLNTLLMASFRTAGPNLDGTGSKVEAGWLYAWLRNPRAFWHEARMPSLRLTEKEAADVTAYLMSLRNEAFMGRPRPAMEQKVRDEAIIEHLLASSTPVKKAQEMLAGMGEEQRTLWLGERTIARHGCFGCHRIPGFETTSPIGTELTEEGSKLVDRLDFGYEEGKIPHTLPGWLKRKFLEPRVFDVGKEKRHEELLRMPKFHFSEEEADALVTAVLSFTKEQMPLAAQRLQGPEDRYVQKGARMVWDFNCQGCHQIGEEPGGFKAIVETQLEQEGREAFEAVGLSPPQLYNAAARMGEGSRVHTQWLHDFLQDPSQTIRPWLEVRMPTFNFTDEEANTLTHYFAALDRVPFPVAPRPALDATMVAHGRELFARWQCVKCHVVAGKLPDQDPSNMAPDLANVPQRLRADWLTQWLADPGRVQPGTRMPANFPANPAENAYPEILGGDQKQQVDAVRQYLLTLGPAGMKPAGRASRGGGAATAGQ